MSDEEQKSEKAAGMQAHQQQQADDKEQTEPDKAEPRDVTIRLTRDELSWLFFGFGAVSAVENLSAQEKHNVYRIAREVSRQTRAR
jgi:hypothetical protein